jgi:cell division protein FtsI/penicillin-binding protein 2
MPSNSQDSAVLAVKRIRVWFALVIIVVGVFAVRLFYVQVIHYNHYHKAALNDQLEEYEIPATRGLIEANENGQATPIVLNQKLYTLFADPTIVKDAGGAANKIASAIGGTAANYKSEMLTPQTRYVVLANKLTQDQANKVTALKIAGVDTKGVDYRTYPDGQLASQLLGFVNDSGQGEYGVEQALNKELSGTPGQLKAITDINGVPLAASNSNVEKAPVPGKNVVLSINAGMQAQMETILQNEYQKTKSKGISALIMNPSNGQIAAMANYPTYNPADYQQVTNPALFQNAAVTNAIEPGSSMKTLTTSAALDQGVIQPNTSFYDPAHWVVDGFNITDIEQDGGPRQQNIASILALSLNTGAVWMLMQMGGGQINDKGIQAWHDYMTSHFLLGQTTGIEQGYESAGYVPPANFNDPSVSLTFAETAFGQGVTLTAVQLAAALSSVLNGGTYYQPTLVNQTIAADGTVANNLPKILKKNTVGPKIGQELIPLMQNVVTTYLHEGYSFMNFPSNYLVGGKTGTAQIASPSGGYLPNTYNGTYTGFVGGTTTPQYVIVVYNIEPNVPGYAGALGGQPVFADLAHMLINEGYVSPKS